ncbi:DUF456 domain-containing protein [Pseudarthrobacter sp. P1]|uniref:DUF456 domain-containing protein n=1 Tax=Pseudarthrobacter sp. P1 TaxID=3418418 RepID=UPI003CF3F087
MDAHVIWTIICGLMIAVGATGVIVPVLPGSVLIGLALLVWALVVAQPVGWIVFGIGAALVVAGMLSSAVLTGRTMKARQIPSRSIIAGLVLGIVGFFVVPVVGLLLGFAVGLFLSEWERQRGFKPALASSGAALKATGLGILAEFGFASLAAGTWALGVLVYFLSR